MMPVSRPARVLVSIAVVSLVAMVLVYAFPPSDRRIFLFFTDLSWGWAAAFAAFACYSSARRVTTSEQRRTWRWIGAGCASFFLGQLVWTWYDLWRAAPPPYPSFADVGFLGIYVCLMVGVLTLVRGQPLRRADPELVLDSILVTFTVGALAYDYLLEPLLTTEVSTTALITSIGWSIGAIAVLWMILIALLRRPVFPAATSTLVLPGVVALAIGNQVYAVVALRGSYRAGGWLDLTWDAGLLLIAAAAALAPDYGTHLQRGRATTAEGSNAAARVAALVVGLAGVTGMAIVAVRREVPDADDAVIIGVGMAIIATRVLYSLGADRRYARVLEDEVANQTRSLMSSLGATASAERNLRLLMEAVPDAITVVDRDGQVLDENTAGRSLVSARLNEAKPESGRRTAFGWLEGTAARIARENLLAAFDGSLRRFEVPFPRPDGNDGTAQVLLAAVREGGRIPKVLMLVRDITEQRRTQTQLQQAEKLAAMGQLVSGVAHEINNPAAIISGFAQTLLLDQLTPDQRETVQMMYDEATRIGRITSNLLAFARAGSKERTLVELNETVRRTFALRSYHLTTLNITVNLELDDANPKAWANGSEVQQMLLNLLINAEQALTTIPAPGRRAITIRTMTAGDDGVQLQVADTGPGIPADIQEKIFDPFFTTKPEGMGTGLGLSICYGIVHDHGGRIGVHSIPGHGATFTISLPRDARQRNRTTPPPMEIPEAAREPAEGGALSILLVDDEEGLRRAVLTFLKRRGMNVLAVEDGSDALRALRRERFDIIVSDVRMPGMSGAEFLQGLRREHPAMVNRLIFTTGDTFAADTSSLLRDAGVPSLVKPYDFSKLESVIREVELAARTSA